METRNPSISPLLQRMIDDMRMRKLNPKTQTAYVRAVRNFTKTSANRPTPPPSRICATTSFIWLMPAPRRYP